MTSQQKASGEAPVKSPAKPKAGRTPATFMSKPGLAMLVHPKIAPFTVCVCAMPVSLLARLRWGGDATMTTILTAMAAGLTVVTWGAWGRRHEQTRALATGFVGGVSTWMVLAIAGNPLHRPLLDAWIIGSVVLPAAWLIRGAGLSVPHEYDKAQGKGDILAGKIQAFKNARTKRVTETESQLKARIQLDSPVTAEEVQSAASQIASVAAVGADQVSVARVRGREDQVDLSLTHATDTARTIFYEGPKHAGESVADAPIWFGKRVDSTDLEIWLCGSASYTNPRPLAHTLTTGMSGSGKTETVKALILDMRFRTDVVPVVGDPAKFGQSFGEIEDVLGLAAKDEAQTRRLLHNLPQAIKYRAELFGRLPRDDGGIGYSQWVPEMYTKHGIPLLFVDIEEATDVLEGDSEDMDDAVRKARSVGIHLCVSLQVAVYTNIDRKTRGQFGNALAHGCKEDQDAKFALSDESRSAGADPTKWQNDKPGSLYGELVGAPRESWPVDARCVLMTYEDKMKAKEDSKKYWATMDPGTLAILGAGILPAQQETVVRTGPTAVIPGTEDYEEEEAELVLTGVAVSGEDGTMAIDITQPINMPVGPGVEFITDPEPPEMDADTAMRVLRSELAKLEQTQEIVKASDLGDLRLRIGRKRSWVYFALNKLVETGELVQDNGKPPYRFPHRTASTGPVSASVS